MDIIYILTDKDFGLEATPLENPKKRNASRGIVIRESDGKIALQYKRNKNQYKLVGGGIEEGENSKDAFIREILEETGCDIEITKELGVLKEYRNQKNFEQNSYVYVGKVIKDNHILNLTQREKAEGAELIWVSPQNALELIINNYDLIKESEFENVYSGRFVALRDRKILEYYLSNL